jgi:hypothetical protein
MTIEKVVRAFSSFADEAVLHTDRLIALSGQGLQWMADTAPKPQVAAGLTEPDLTKRIFIGAMEAEGPKQNSTVTTLGDIVSAERLDNATSWLTVACLIEICAYWQSEVKVQLAAALKIPGVKQFREPVLEAAVLRRNEYIHGFKYCRKDLPAIGPFLQVSMGEPVCVSQEELRDFRDYLLNGLPRVTREEWSAYATFK